MTTGALLAGVDEVGRGAIAGPVVAGACVLTAKLEKHAGDPPWWSPKDCPEVRIADSKILTPDERELSAAWIRNHSHWALGWSSAEDIDALGILCATEKAMQEAVATVRGLCEVTALLVDGRDKFWFDLPHMSIIKGDQTEPAIAAASIVAKVARDEWISDQGAVHPGYGFGDHKGYGTPDHQAALKQLGPCPLHRQTFLHADSSKPRARRRPSTPAPSAPALA